MLSLSCLHPLYGDVPCAFVAEWDEEENSTSNTESEHLLAATYVRMCILWSVTVGSAHISNDWLLRGRAWENYWHSPHNTNQANNLVEAHGYVINEQQRRFRAIYVRSMVQNVYLWCRTFQPEGLCQLQSTRCLVLCSWQRPPGGNVLHHILNHWDICCSETTLLLFID